LISSLERTNSIPHVLISSSSQEEINNLYGKSKKEGRLLLMDWASNNKALVSGLIIPNVFGPFGTPFYNSVVATFSHQIINKITPKINIDSNLKLIYINELIAEIILIIEKRMNNPLIKINETFEIKVSGILSLLTSFNSIYIDKGEIPKFMNSFELNLFNTFRSYMDIENIYPVKYKQHKDSRGSFVEILRSEMPGQISFSTTEPGIARGNHFHTRKIERFSVVKGKALIQLRKIGTEKVFNFFADGDEPAYVDIPIWYTHNIKNIGDDILYTSFWINEPYNPEDTDTYFVEV
jgi:UDP-2-acetamido-2,6-beta-L-arabino-hexul-4-ose reductase